MVVAIRETKFIDYSYECPRCGEIYNVEMGWEAAVDSFTES